MATEGKPEIRLLLERALEEPPREKAASGIRAQLGEHRDLIVKALRKGYSATALARFFNENGIDASVDTLRAYVAEVAGKKRKKPRVQKAAQAAPRTRKSPAKQPRPEPTPQSLAQSEPEEPSMNQEGKAQPDDRPFHPALKRKL